MKYLFLDIDGVLNHEEWYNRIVLFKGIFKEWWEHCFDPECVKRLNNILKRTGARLVVSSSWRIDKHLKRYFRKVGITTDFDITPSLRYIDKDGYLTWPDRGDEIAKFLKDHPCDTYVILDDDTDFNEDQIKNHFIHCCNDLMSADKEGNPGKTGLTEEKMIKAINILNS